MTILNSCAGLSHNATADVLWAIRSLGAEGGTLSFEPGEYHFYEDGAASELMYPVYNAVGEKTLAFPLDGVKDLTVDGNGAVFVFHGRILPFRVVNAENILLRNFTVDTATPPMVDARAVEIDADGFTLEIDRALHPFTVENGHIAFDLGSYVRSTADSKLSVHATDRMLIRYLFAGDCGGNRVGLPAPFMDSDAADLGGNRVRFTYRSATEIAFPYELGEPVILLLDELRHHSVFSLQDSRNVTLEDVTVRVGGSFGVLAQTCENLTVRRMRTDTSFHGNRMSLTADAFHIVNCTGSLLIEDCAMSSFLDDVCNIHGNYAVFDSLRDGILCGHLGYRSHHGLEQLREGDAVTVIDSGLNTVAHGRVGRMRFTDEERMRFTVPAEFTDGEERLQPGMLIEVPGRMPDVVIRGCDFGDYPHLRISGAGKMLIENNRFHDSCRAILVSDLVHFWFESGRVKDLTVRGNVFDNCTKLGGDSVIDIGVEGFPFESTPVVHGRIAVENNVFLNLNGAPAVKACGVRDLILTGNTLDGREQEVNDPAFVLA